MLAFDQSTVTTATPEQVWKLLYDPSRFPEWWAGVGSVEAGGDAGDYTMFPDGYPEFPMPQTLEVSQDHGAVKISCLVSDLCFDWRLRPSGSGTEISVHVQIPDQEVARVAVQRDLIHQSLLRLAGLAAATA